jgi:hypothetical protein
MQLISALQTSVGNKLPFLNSRQHSIAAKKEKQDIPASLKIYRGGKSIKSACPIERFLPLGNRPNQLILPVDIVHKYVKHLYERISDVDN